MSILGLASLRSSAFLVKLAGAADRIGSIYPAYFPFNQGITIIGAPVRWDQSILRVRDIKNTRSHFASRHDFLDIEYSEMCFHCHLVPRCGMRVYPVNCDRIAAYGVR